MLMQWNLQSGSLNREDNNNLGPAEDFSKNFGPTHKGKGKNNRNKKKRKRDPFDNPDTVFAGQPGAPESQSYFELMGDFFDKPDINVFEEVNNAAPVFPNFPAQDIDRTTHRTPIYVDTSDEPIFRGETEPGKQQRRLLRGLGSTLGGPNRFEAGPEFEALKENLADVGEERNFGHTTPLYHPYAEPLSHYNPLDEAHDDGDIEVFRDSARARRPTSPPPPLPEPSPLRQEGAPFHEPPRLKAPRRLHLPQMNVGQILDDHRELRPDFSEIQGDFREGIKPLGHSTLGHSTRGHSDLGHSTLGHKPLGRPRSPSRGEPMPEESKFKIPVGWQIRTLSEL